MVEAFTTLSATGCPFYRDDIDTDQIIPARFLKGTGKSGLGKQVFYDWRYDDSGQLKPDAVFNRPDYAQSQILVSGHNFGCGSSREHAPWALRDFGFRAVVAISFADIFYNNALKNSLLPVALPEAEVKQLIQFIERDPTLTISIDLEQQQIAWPGQVPLTFPINTFRKTCLLQGVDDIGYVLSHLPAIEAFETQPA